MSEPTSNGRVNVSDEKLAASLAQLELSLVKQMQQVVAPLAEAVARKADSSLLSDVQLRLAALELKQAGSASVSSFTRWVIGTVLVAIPVFAYFASAH